MLLICYFAYFQEKVKECYYSKDNLRFNNISNDTIAKVFDPEKHGEVQEQGFGANPTH